MAKRRKNWNEPEYGAPLFAWDDPHSPYNWEHFTRHGLPVRMMGPDDDAALFSTKERKPGRLHATGNPNVPYIGEGVAPEDT